MRRSNAAEATEAAVALKDRGFLLEEDIDGVVARVEKTVRFEPAN